MRVVLVLVMVAVGIPLLAGCQSARSQGGHGSSGAAFESERGRSPARAEVLTSAGEDFAFRHPNRATREPQYIPD